MPEQAAALAAFYVAAEGGGATGLDGRHHLQLREAYMASMLGTPGGAVTMEDVRDLYRGAHRRLSRSGPRLP